MGISWRLKNIVTGDSRMQRGRMDLEFEEGGVDPLTEPTAIAAQRIEKATVTPQGSSRFSAFGSPFPAILGAKMVPEERAREVGAGLRLLVDTLVSEQSRVARRVPLAPEETIVGLRKARILVGTDTITTEANIALGDGTLAVARPEIDATLVA